MIRWALNFVVFWVLASLARRLWKVWVKARGLEPSGAATGEGEWVDESCDCTQVSGIAAPIFVFADSELADVCDPSPAELEAHGFEWIDIDSGVYDAYDMDGQIIDITWRGEVLVTPTRRVDLEAMVDRATKYFMTLGKRGFEIEGVQDVRSLPPDRQGDALLELVNREYYWEWWLRESSKKWFLQWRRPEPPPTPYRRR